MNSGYYTSVAQLPRDFQPKKKKKIDTSRLLSVYGPLDRNDGARQG